MANKFDAEGNIATAPEFKEFDKTDETKCVCNFSVYFDNAVPTDDGFEDKGGFYHDVEIFGVRARKCYELFTKGCRVSVSGKILSNNWVDDNGEKHYRNIVRAKRINPDLMSVATLMERNNGDKKND